VLSRYVSSQQILLPDGETYRRAAKIIKNVALDEESDEA
jgi:hypothetical protein